MCVYIDVINWHSHFLIILPLYNILLHLNNILYFNNHIKILFDNKIYINMLLIDSVLCNR